MRNITFRGKRLDNGEWVYGGYVETQNHEHYIIMWDSIYALDNGLKTITSKRFVKVNPDTVGQYTELKDNSDNDVEIYHHDVVNFAVGENRYIGIIEYEVGTYIISCKKLPGHYIELNEYFTHENNIVDVEVIGNIHDNPELLEDNNER